MYGNVMNPQNVIYIWDKNLLEQCNRLPAVKNRASIVHQLIYAYNLFGHTKVVNSKPATYNDLQVFHSEHYLNHIKTLENVDSEYVPTRQDEDYGIGYDCPPVPQMFNLVSAIAGGSLTAAKCLLLGFGNIAINWCGGWHHANKFGAEGFCYVNDIVLAIETLRKKFNKVLYIDLDVHHGNGVQDAYYGSNSVFTLSFHKCEPGFYPGTGLLNDIGAMQGKGYTCNVPLNAGYTDKTMNFVFHRLWSCVYKLFQPDAIVVQCGADALASDPQGGANLTIESYCTCIKMVLDKRKPTLLLGGGGYNHSNTAKLWASITALAVGVKLEDDIPEHDYWMKYGPYYVLSIEPTLIRDMNKQEYLEECVTKVEKTLENTFTIKRHPVYNLPIESESLSLNPNSVYDFTE